MKAVNVPPLTVTSDATKSLDASLRLKVKVATSPLMSALSLELMLIDGAVTSTLKLKLPARF